MVKFLERIGLLALVATTGVQGNPMLPGLGPRDPTCSADNLLNKLRRSTEFYVPYCQTYLNAITYTTVAVQTISPTTTTSSAASTSLAYPASRISSACGCLSVPILTKTVSTVVGPSTGSSITTVMGLPTGNSCPSVSIITQTVTVTTTYMANATSSLPTTTILAVSSSMPSQPASSCNPDPVTPSGYAFTFGNVDETSRWINSNWNTNITYPNDPTIGKPVMRATLGVVSLYRTVGLIPGATYKLSMRTYQTTSKVYIWARPGSSSPILDAPQDVLNQWRVSEEEFTTQSGVETLRFYMAYQSQDPENVGMVSDYSLTLVSLPNKTIPTLDTSKEMVYVEWRDGKTPSVTQSLSAISERPTNVPDVTGPAAPGYGGAAFAHLVDLSKVAEAGESGGYDARFTIYLQNTQVPDSSANASYVSRIRYKSENSNGCSIEMGGYWGSVAQLASGCTESWSELVSDPMLGNAAAFHSIQFMCFDPNPIKAKFYLDDFRLYPVVNSQ